MKTLILFSLILCKVIRQPSLIVRVSNGLVRGRLSEDGSLHEFLGIPYATTTPETRFQAPLSEPTWDYIFEAIDEHARCPQRISKTIVIGQEDCLVLNVYVPANVATRGPLPVMTYIHGGGFYDGSGYPSMYGPEYLVRHGVILVSINYRVNIQGFLCLGIKQAPGNAGLKDQVAALRWIQRNIAAFGGDPNDVTLFGESAGAASVSLHLLSPMSEGLFHKAILQSGSSTASWVNQYDPMNMAHLLALELGYNTRDPHELYDIFMNKTYQELIVTRVPRPKNNIIISELLFIPCIEKEIEGVEAFITDFPYNLLREGRYRRMPIMIGYNSHEGLLFMASENHTTVPDVDIRKSMPRNLHFATDEERNEEAERVRRFYFGDKEISLNTLVELAGFHGDPYFKFPVIVETEIVSGSSAEPVFSYEFGYDGWINMGKFKSGLLHAPGASHADELFYIFKPRAIPLPQNVLETEMINKMTTLWTNFAKYGNPTPEPTDLLPEAWLPTTPRDPNTFVIDRGFSTKGLWEDPAMLMWRDIYKRINDLDIRGIPEQKGENTMHLLRLLATKLGVKLDDSDVVWARRSGRPRRVEDSMPRVIHVRLLRRAMRDDLLRGARVRRSLTTTDLDLENKPTKIYVNEHLIFYNRMLFHKTRELARTNDFSFAWTRDGRIFVRQREGKPAMRVSNHEDLVQIFRRTDSD